MESELSGLFEVKLFAKKSAWILEDPFHVYASQSKMHFYETI